MSYSENRRDFADQLSDDNADRLSYLLEAVVFVILSYLSLKECIATSFLLLPAFFHEIGGHFGLECIASILMMLLFQV